jgi:biotin transport system substrate-specific component
MIVYPVLLFFHLKTTEFDRIIFKIYHNIKPIKKGIMPLVVLFVRNFIVAVLFTILLVISSKIVIPLGEISINLNSIIVMLAAGLLGARWGAFSVLIWVLLIALGVPLLSNGIAGEEALTGPFGGTLFGYLIAAFVIGGLIRIASRRRITWIQLFFFYAIGWIGVMNVVTMIWMMSVMHLSVDAGFFSQTYLFLLPVELFKVGLAASITLALYRAFPALSPQGRFR